jgi:hypothetical protein
MTTTKVSAKHKNLLAAKSSSSSILAVSDLNSDLIHYAIVREPDTSVSIPAHSLEVKTPNGVKLSRVFDDKLDKANLKKGNPCVVLFMNKNGYANVDRISSY